MTNTSPARASSDPPRRRGERTGATEGRLAAPGLVALLLLAGCVNDTASYRIDDSQDHSIMLHRVQEWLWQDTIKLTIAANRMPECRGGIDVRGVPLRARPELYEAPPQYAEPIYILKIGARHFAISTQSCRVQEFSETPPDLGRRLGTFAEKDGKFGFQPAGG
ncbi:MAG: hypothetical protein ACK4TK_05890 [Thiobacillaceae bacterium]